jgi:hypothetical protein
VRAFGRAESARERVRRRESAAATEKKNMAVGLSESINLIGTVPASAESVKYG